MEKGAEGGGESRVWSLRQPFGKTQPGDELIPGRLLFKGTMLRPFDTLILLDRDVKHEALPFTAEDASKPARRTVSVTGVWRPGT